MKRQTRPGRARREVRCTLSTRRRRARRLSDLHDGHTTHARGLNVGSGFLSTFLRTGLLSLDSPRRGRSRFVRGYDLGFADPNLPRGRTNNFLTVSLVFIYRRIVRVAPLVGGHGWERTGGGRVAVNGIGG